MWSFRLLAGCFCLFWGLFHVEEVDGDWAGDGETVPVFFGGNGGGFDIFDGVEEPVEFHEAVKVVDSNASEGGFEAKSVLVENFGGFRLGGEYVGEGGEVVDGFHFLNPLRVVSIFLIDIFIIS